MLSEYTVYIAPLARIHDLRMSPTSNAQDVLDELRGGDLNVTELYV